MGWAHDVELLYQAKFEGVEIKTMAVEWEHQDESKVSLVKDSLKMLWQTVTISARLNWNWFVRQPLRDLKNRSFVSVEPSWYRLLFVLVSMGLFFLMPMLSLDYGITVDEMEHQIYGEKILSYLETGGEDKTAISYKNYYTSGGLFDFSAAFLNKYIFDVDSFKLRHF